MSEPYLFPMGGRQSSAADAWGMSAKRIRLETQKSPSDKWERIEEVPPALPPSTTTIKGTDYLCRLNDYMTRKGNKNAHKVEWIDRESGALGLVAISLKIDNGTIQANGEGKTKKLAKQAAAQQVLIQLHSNDPEHARNTNQSTSDVTVSQAQPDSMINTYQDALTMLKGLDSSDPRVVDVIHLDLPDTATLLRLYEKKTKRQPAKLEVKLSRRPKKCDTEEYIDPGLLFNFQVTYNDFSGDVCKRCSKHGCDHP
uniref:Pasha n=1 Tax=Sphaeroforma napiecek TaxID=1618200 RepID=A0A383QRY9_9EUKA|nr:Pasha [Sphaeroforma napiecek]